MKRSRVSILVSLLLLITTFSFAQSSGKKVGYIIAGPDDYYKKGEKLFRALGEREGWKITTINSEYSPEKELANVNDFIVKKMDAIVMVTTNSDIGAQAAKLANDARIPIFFVTAIPNPKGPGKIDGYAGYDWETMGQTIGEYIGKAYPTSKSVTIDGFYGQGTTEALKKGYIEALDKASGGRAKYIGGNTGEWQRTKAIPVIEDFLASGKDFDIIFAMNEEMAAGVIQVLEEQGLSSKYKVISQNGKEAAWDWIKAGKMDCTVCSSPTLEADVAFQQVKSKFEGKKYPIRVQAKMFVLNKSNLDKAVPWETDAYLKARDANVVDYDITHMKEIK